MQKSKLQEVLANNLKKGFSAVAPTQWSDEQDALIWGRFSKLKYSGFGYPLLDDFSIGGLVFSELKNNKEYEQFIEKNNYYDLNYQTKFHEVFGFSDENRISFDIRAWSDDIQRNINGELTAVFTIKHIACEIEYNFQLTNTSFSLFSFVDFDRIYKFLRKKVGTSCLLPRRHQEILRFGYGLKLIDATTIENVCDLQSDFGVGNEFESQFYRMLNRDKLYKLSPAMRRVLDYY